MNMPLRSGYSVLFVLLAAIPIGVVACSDDTSSAPDGAADSGADSSSDGGSDARPEDAAADARSDARALQDAAPPTIECATEPCIVDISSGNDDTCALTKTGDVYCWGDNACGEVGAPIGGTDFEFKPVAAARKVLSGARAISAGASSTCAILKNGELQCWGSLVASFSDRTSGGYGRSCTPNATPTPVDGVPHLATVSTTMSNGCGVSESGDLWCWGSSFNYLLGRAGYPTCSYSAQCERGNYPAARADLIAMKVEDVRVSYGGVFVFDQSNRPWSWGGAQTVGRTTSMAVDPTPLPVDLPYTTDLAISPFGDGQYTANNVCAATQGQVYCWGDYQTPPRIVAIPQDQYATQVSASFHSCARTTEGVLYCWGSNQAGQLGDGKGIDSPIVPTKVEGLKAKAVKVAASKATTCALLLTGEVQCWGANDKGQLGIGAADYLPHLQPTTVVAFQ